MRDNEMQHGLSMFGEFEKLKCNPNFRKTSQVFPLPTSHVFQID